jgi:hypothetical protein
LKDVSGIDLDAETVRWKRYAKKLYMMAQLSVTARDCCFCDGTGLQVGPHGAKERCANNNNNDNNNDNNN